MLRKYERRFKAGFQPNLPADKIAYAAGAWNAKGTIKRYPDGISITLRAKDAPLLDRMKKWFGGNIYNDGGDGHRWVASSYDAIGFLNATFRYLTTSRRLQLQKECRYLSQHLVAALSDDIKTFLQTELFAENNLLI